MMKIITRYNPRPFPSRACDWVVYVSEYAPGNPIGMGATRDEAIKHLLEQRQRRGLKPLTTFYVDAVLTFTV